MKKYEYVTVNLEGNMITMELKKHREIIDKYAALGYRYVGYLPTEFWKDGHMSKIDLIFEVEY
ncbi:MAG: DUF4177 domain-containing protein [Eubacteriales bacterium]|nr:DUF4177 domain-containing protein [Eubacteriales bacterium]